MSYESYCAACTYLTDNGWCERKGENHKGSDPRCYSFCEAYSRSDSARENLYDYTPTSGCYLTTIVCKILNFDDNNYYLNTLRKFRDNTMKTNPKYISLLLTYDIVGPTIARNLENDKNNKEIAEVFFDKYIVPSVDAIEAGKEQTAINIYTSMTDELAKHYDIDINIINPNLDKIDMDYLGHGKIRTRKPSNI